MKPIYLLLIAVCLVFVGCNRNKNGVYNPNYDRMEKLADETQANPSDKTALHKLEKYTTSWSYWNRFYAYVYLWQLAIKNVVNCEEVVPFLNKALKNPDQAIRREAASAIDQIGAVAVDKTLPTLSSIVQQGEEDDVTWFSAEALGKLEDSKKSQEVLPILLKAANKPPPEETQDEAPQVRYYALDSIIELAKKNNLNTIPDLEKLLSESKSPYKERVAKAILELNPTNEAAKKVLNSSAVK